MMCGPRAVVTGVNEAQPPPTPWLLKADEWVAALQAWRRQGSAVSKQCAATPGLAHPGSLPGGGGVRAGL